MAAREWWPIVAVLAVVAVVGAVVLWLVLGKAKAEGGGGGSKTIADAISFSGGSFDLTDQTASSVTVYPTSAPAEMWPLTVTALAPVTVHESGHDTALAVGETLGFNTSPSYRLKFTLSGSRITVTFPVVQ